MRPTIDPRRGDIEDDASSTKRRSMLSLAGSLLAEISFPKLLLAGTLLLILPALALGIAPIVVSFWIDTFAVKFSTALAGVWSLLLLLLIVAVGWFGGRQLFRLVESSFWSLNALAVQPVYAMCREALSQLTDKLLPSDVPAAKLAKSRSVTAAVSGILICGLSLVVLALVWPSTRLYVEFSTIRTVYGFVVVALANSIALVAAYVAVGALIWAFADASMPQPRDLDRTHARGPNERTPNERIWRVAHLSDIHVVGGQYGFRLESGRSGTRGNDRLKRALARLDEIHAEEPLHAVLITGDITDAGLSTEWAEFHDALAAHPKLAERALIIPGNHDLNIVDRANPARVDLPTSPNKRLRRLRALSAMNEVQGQRVRVVDRGNARLGESLDQTLRSHAPAMATFADTGRPWLFRALTELWSNVFPMVLPPDRDDGLGIILLDSNADTHFSFTNALGMVSTEQTRGAEIAIAQYPRAGWIVALHHHVVEYPRAANAISERIGTALINGNWFVRRLRPLASRIVLMHGHRHIDWMGECAGLAILSAPSPCMEITDDLASCFYIHTLVVGSDAGLRLLSPRQVVIAGSAASNASG
jgi:predicted MPP superfamily phosphohydrolase